MFYFLSVAAKEWKEKKNQKNPPNYFISTEIMELIP